MYKPNFRYEHWFELEENERAAANDMLKYTSLSWNVLGLNTIENSGWEELSEYERLGATSVGFNDLTWNCWQNHFRHYSWADIHFYGLDFPYTELGWTEESWEGTDAAPLSQGKSWAELTSDERKAAIELCYFRENWDGVDMTPNYSAFPYPKVKQRYVEWSLLPASIRRSAKGSLMYNKTTWNILGTAEIEDACWDKLTEEQRANAIDMGFYQRTWDCFQCHYRSYFWDEIDEESKDALQVLGWSETSWNMNEIPPSYENEWDRLSENDQEIASQLCFFEDNWNKQNLEGVIFQEVTGVNEDGTDIIQEVIGVSEKGEAIYGQEIVGATEGGELIYKQPGDTFGGTLGDGSNIVFAPGAAPDSPPSSVDMIRINGIVVCIVMAVIQQLLV